MLEPSKLLRGDVITLEGYKEEFTVILVYADIILLSSKNHTYRWKYNEEHIEFRKIDHILLQKPMELKAR